MKKHLLLGAALLLHASAWAATYTFTSTLYDPPTKDYTAPCAVGNCANFTLAMRQTGSFTTSQPLDSNLNNADISALIQSYAFNDGLTQYSSLGANDLIHLATVTTDAVGNITNAGMVFLQWQTNSHGAGDRLNYLGVNGASYTNMPCTSLSPANQCNGFSSQDPSTSFAILGNAGPFAGWTPVAAVPAASAAIPTLSEWSLLLLAGLLGGLGHGVQRRRQQRST